MRKFVAGETELASTPTSAIWILDLRCACPEGRFRVWCISRFHMTLRSVQFGRLSHKAALRVSNPWGAYARARRPRGWSSTVATISFANPLKFLNAYQFFARLIHLSKTSRIIHVLFAKGHGVMIRVVVAKAGALAVGGRIPTVGDEPCEQRRQMLERCLRLRRAQRHCQRKNTGQGVWRCHMLIYSQRQDHTPCFPDSF